MRSPLLQDHITLKPYQLYESAAKLMRVYTEWLSGDAAWQMQVNQTPFSAIHDSNALNHSKICPLTQLFLGRSSPQTRPTSQR